MSNEKDSKAIHELIGEWCGEGRMGIFRQKVVEYITTARKEARAEARRECAEFFSHWLLRAYEGIHRDTSYEEGESLDSLARELNQVIGFAGYEPESTARQLLLNKKFAWNELHLDEAATTTQKGENDG